MAKADETYVARVKTTDRSYGFVTEYESPPKRSAQAAMQADRVAEACKRKRHVEVRSNYTNDGTHWPGHRGRIAAVCEHGRWVTLTHSELKGARKRRSKSCPSNVGKIRAPKRLRRRR